MWSPTNDVKYIDFAVERPKPIRPSPGPAGIKRTSSLDTIAVPYLTGQWPRGDYQTQLPVGPDYLDKTTQVGVCLYMAIPF